MSTLHGTVTLAVPAVPMDHSTGPDHAPVTLVEYGDFECPTCAAVEPAVRQLRERYPVDMRFVFRHFPLEDAHPHALLAAAAAEAAAAQGQFWPMHDRLIAHPTHLKRSDLDRHAAALGLDTARFAAELNDDIYLQRIREHQDGGRRSHLRATPTFFVNGVVQDVSGGMEALFQRVAAAIKAAHAR